VPKNILVVCPTQRDYRELAILEERANKNFHSPLKFTYFSPDEDKLNLINSHLVQNHFQLHQNFLNLLKLPSKEQIEAVFYTSDFPGTSLAALIAHELNLPGPHPEIAIRSQHKYYARLDQQQIVPEATPYFMYIEPELIDQIYPSLPFPSFIKPIKSAFSIGAQKLKNYHELCNYLVQKRNKHAIDLFENILKTIMLSHTIKSSNFILEELLEGEQVTLEGFVYNHEVTIIGIVDSVMFPNSLSFARFQYPSNLPDHIQKKMITIAKKYICGLKLNNLFFNIEFMYNAKKNTVHIIELNPRLVSQFADLYEKVDGIHSYQLLLDLICGKKPLYEKKQGQYKYAASCVLRIFQDQFVVKVPTQQNITTLYEQFPESRFELCCQENKKLSDVLQDGHSYRYGLVHLGGNSQEDILEKFKESQKILNFILKPSSFS